MKVGDQVKWAQPSNEVEGNERFTLVEVNGDRCFIRYICDLPIPPVQVARVSDLMLDNVELRSSADER